ncbi:MAG: hypothetical protein RR825_08715, partial [Ruthenibacterium sp.]
MDNNGTPNLTFDTSATEQPAQAIAAAAEAVTDAKATLVATGVPTAPALTLDNTLDAPAAKAAEPAPVAAAVLDDSTLSADEK